MKLAKDKPLDSPGSNGRAYHNNKLHFVSRGLGRSLVQQYDVKIVKKGAAKSIRATVKRVMSSTFGASSSQAHGQIFHMPRAPD